MQGLAVTSRDLTGGRAANYQASLHASLLQQRVQGGLLCAVLIVRGCWCLRVLSETVARAGASRFGLWGLRVLG